MARYSEWQSAKENPDDEQTKEQDPYCRPPAPPGGDDQWELQYCRWWGWNWVKRQEPVGRDKKCTTSTCPRYNEQARDDRCRYRYQSSRPPDRERKVKKKHIWDFCKFLCGKKKREDTTELQTYYTTPSNSTTLCRLNKCGIYGREDEIRDLEEARNLSRRQNQRPPKGQKGRRKDPSQSVVMVKQEWSGSTCMEYSCNSNRPRSSTDESVEFLNVSCGCRCQRSFQKNEEPKMSEQPSKTTEQPSKPDDEYQNKQNMCSCRVCNCGFQGCACSPQRPTRNVTICPSVQDPDPNSDKCCKSCHSDTRTKYDCQTQTIVEERTQTVKTETRKKRKLVVTCHCCCCKCLESSPQQKSKPQIDTDKCKCYNNATNDTQTNADAKPQDTKDDKKRRFSKDESKTKKNEIISEKIPETTIQTHLIEHIIDKSVNINKYLPFGFAKKEFPRYGPPSKGRPLLQYTKSDISDKVYSMKLDDEFSSPVSGKTYNLSPVKIGNFDEFSGKKLPELMEIDDEIKYLRKLESEAKMDISSRVLLDAMCDAILNKNQDIDCFSSYMNQLTYDHKDAVTGKEFDSFVPERQISDFLLKDYASDKSTGCSTFHHNDSVNLVDEMDQLVDNLLRTRKPSHKVNTDDVLYKYGLKTAFDTEIKENNTSLFHNTMNFFGDGNTSTDYSYLDAEFPVVYAEKNNKRPASPLPVPDIGYKKSRTENNFHPNLNLNDIFKKIDEIALKSEENDLKINKVLGSLQRGNLEDAFEQSSEKPQDILNKINGMVQKNQFSVTEFEIDVTPMMVTGRNTSIRENNILEESIERGSDEPPPTTSRSPRSAGTSRDSSKSRPVCKSRPVSKDRKKEAVKPKNTENGGQSLIPVKRPPKCRNNKKK